MGIARGMLAEPDVVVIGGPTSSLDVLHEKGLMKTLREEYPEKTLFIISHRSSRLQTAVVSYGWKMEGLQKTEGGRSKGTAFIKGGGKEGMPLFFGTNSSIYAAAAAGIHLQRLFCF